MGLLVLCGSLALFVRVSARKALSISVGETWTKLTILPIYRRIYYGALLASACNAVLNLYTACCAPATNQSFTTLLLLAIAVVMNLLYYMMFDGSMFLFLTQKKGTGAPFNVRGTTCVPPAVLWM